MADKVSIRNIRTGAETSVSLRYAKILLALGKFEAVQSGVGSSSPKTDGPLISEAVIEFAKQSGIDYLKVSGTGANGRITKKDIEAALPAKG